MGATIDHLKTITKNAKNEIQVYRLVLADPRTPRLSKFFLGAAVGYVLLPFDLIPDFIPVLGLLDDVIIIPLLVWLAMKNIPPLVLEDCRAQVMEKSTQ
ncbi:MAG: YkvA family protein [Ignavibacteriales bacterium]